MQYISIRGARTHNLREHRPGPAPGQADRHHGAVRVRQVLPGLRHALRGRPAALRGVPVGLCPPVPVHDGQARRGPHRGPVAGHLHRAEDRLPQPALHRRHGHRDLRLPAPALRPGRHPPLPGPRAGPRRRRPCSQMVDQALALPEGTRLVLLAPVVHGRKGEHTAAARRPAQPGLRARPHRRRDLRAGRPAEAGPAQEAHHRGGGGPLQGPGRHQAAAGRVLRDRPEARRRRGQGGAHGGQRQGSAGRPRRRGGHFLRPLRLPDLRLQHRRSSSRGSSPSTTRPAPARPATASA